MRSDLRQRAPVDPYEVPPSMRPGPPSDAPRMNRDSVGTTSSDAPARRPSRAQIKMPPAPRGAATDDGGATATPSPGAERAFDTVMRTFQGAAAAGNRRRATENGGFGDVDYEREEAEKKRKERERADRERRERMREREAQQQLRSHRNRRKGAGDIDGASCGTLVKCFAILRLYAHTATAVLDEIQGEWEWVTQPDVCQTPQCTALRLISFPVQPRRACTITLGR